MIPLDADHWEEPKQWFSLETAEKYGIKTKRQCGQIYAICPHCNAGWKLLEDALKCCSTPLIEESEEEQKLRIAIQRSIRIEAQLRMKSEYLIVVAKNESSFNNWRQGCNLKKSQCKFLESEEDFSKGEMIFIGEFQNHPMFSHPRVQEEYLLQQSRREFNCVSYKSDEFGDRIIFSDKPEGELLYRTVIDGKIAFEIPRSKKHNPQG